MPIPHLNKFKVINSDIKVIFTEITNSHGFTFIEMLMVVATMALLFGIGFSNFRGFQERQKLVSAVRIFRADLRFTQEQALAGIKPVGCGTLDAYRLAWKSATTYEIGALCDQNATPIVVKNGDLAKAYPGIRFNAAFGPVTFNVLGRGVRNAITVVLTDEGTPPQTVSISITKGGEVN
jgi:prepilin-type N-terminal cleavage/methylation domain-containing protein